MSSSSRADGRNGAHHHHNKDVFQMPREDSFSCSSENAKEKQQRRDRDGFTRRLSSTISVDGGISTGRRRGEMSHSGRSGGFWSNGWQDDVISRSRSYIESSDHGSGSIAGIGSPSPRFECSSADCSPRELDGYRYSKPNSPLFSQTKISSSLAHGSFSGKYGLAREPSRSSDWYPIYKGDGDYKDKIWGRSDSIKKTGTSSYDSSLSFHKETNGRREHDVYGGSGDISANSYHIRSYQEWRHSERIPSPALPFRSHVSTNGYHKDTTTRTSEVLGSYSSAWSSPLSSPLNYTNDAGREEGSQSSPRKKPRLGWGQGLAKYEKKLSEGADDHLSTKGKKNNEELMPRHSNNLSQFPENEENIAFSKASSGLSDEIKQPSACQKESLNASNLDDKINEIEPLQSFLPDRAVSLDSSQTIELSVASKDNGASVAAPAAECEAPLGSQGQALSDNASANLKTAILQRLEKLELELELTEKELSKVDELYDVHKSTESEKNEDAVGNLLVSDVHVKRHCPEVNDNSGERLCNDVETQAGLNIAGVSNDVVIKMSVVDGENMSLNVHSPAEGEAHSCASSHPPGLISNKEDDTLPQIVMNSLEVKGGSQDSESNAHSFNHPLKLEDSIVESIHCKQLLSNKTDVHDCWIRVYSENQEQAKSVSLDMKKLIVVAKPDFKEALENEIQHCNDNSMVIEKHEKMKQRMREMLLKQKKCLKFREQVLSLKYRAFREIWKCEQAGLCSGNDRAEIWKKTDERKSIALASTHRSSNRLARVVPGISKSDSVSDEIFVMQKLLTERGGDHQRPYLKMPSQILDKKEATVQQFVTRNALVEDPIAVEKERKLMNPWTADEKKIFLDKFILFNKNFKVIASFLKHKTVADCIEYYYRNQKSQEFDKARTKRIEESEFKNQREACTSKYLKTNTSSPRNRRRDMASACMSVDRLPMPVALSSCSDSSTVFQSTVRKNKNYNQFGLADPNIDEGTLRNSDTSVARGGNVVQNSHLLAPITEENDSQWTDLERQVFVVALGMFGKDFKSISQRVGTKTESQCKTFFSKTRKRLKLDQILETFQPNLQDCTEQEAGCDNGGFNVTVGKVNTKHEDTVGMSNDDGVTTYINDKEMINGCSETVGNIDNMSFDKNVGNDFGSARQMEEQNNMDIESQGESEDKNCVADEHSSASSAEVQVNTSDEGDNSQDNDAEKFNCSVLPSNSDKLEKGKHGEDYTSQAEAVPEDRCANQSSYVAKSLMVGVVDFDVDAQKQDSGNSAAVSPKDSESNAYLSMIDASDKPSTEDRGLQSESVVQLARESPDVNQSHVSNSSQVSTAATTASTMVSSASLTKPRGTGLTTEGKPRREATSWTQEEKEKFVEIIRKHGRDWNLLQENLPGKSMTQIKTYFQNSKAKLGLTTTDGNNSRGAGNRKHKNEDSDFNNPPFHLSQHKVDESVLKVDHITNASVASMISMPVSDSNSVSLLGKGKWHVEDSNSFCGMQKLIGFQQIHPTGFTQHQSVSNNGTFSIFPPPALPMLTASGFQQSQNLMLQQPFSHATSSKQLSVLQQAQAQQMVNLQQTPVTALCSVPSHGVCQAKQQQKSTSVSHSSHDYQSQGFPQMPNLFLPHPTMQGFPQSLSSTVFQQQPSSQAQLIIQQGQQQHSSSNSHHLNHALKQNFHYMQQQQSPAIQPLNPLTAVASLQLATNHTKAVNQHHIAAQQLINQLQFYDDQQKQYHTVQNKQPPQQTQSIFTPMPEQLVLQLPQHHKSLQQEKHHPREMRMNFPATVYENSETMHGNHCHASDTVLDKDNKECEEPHTSKPISMQNGDNQLVSKNVSDLSDSIEQKNILNRQQHDSRHAQQFQGSGQACSSSQAQLKSGFSDDSQPARAGDVKLFGQILLSQTSASMISTASGSVIAASSCSKASSCTSGGYCDPCSDGPFNFSPGLAKVGFGYSTGTFVSMNMSQDGRERLVSSAKEEDLQDAHQNQLMSEVIKNLTCENRDNQSKGCSLLPYLEKVEYLQNMQDGRSTNLDLNINLKMNQNNGLALCTGDASVCKAVDKSDISNSSMLATTQSPRAVPECSEHLKDNKFFCSQGISHDSKVDLNALNSVVATGDDTDMKRCGTDDAFVWPHGAMTIECQSSTKDAKAAEHNHKDL